MLIKKIPDQRQPDIYRTDLQAAKHWLADHVAQCVSQWTDMCPAAMRLWQFPHPGTQEPELSLEPGQTICVVLFKNKKEDRE